MKNFILISSWAVTVLGLIFVLSGLIGLGYTYKNISRENITTTSDAKIANKPVRGPLTLLAEINIIRHHTLDSTEQKTFAEMPRQVPLLDENQQPKLDESGQTMMTENSARNIWVTATTLMSALYLSLLAYAFFGLIIFIGLTMAWFGQVAIYLNK